MTTNSLLFQIQMSEQNTLLCGGELHDNHFLILSQLSSTLSYHLVNYLCPCIKLVHSSATNVTIECQNDNSVFAVLLNL